MKFNYILVLLVAFAAMVFSIPTPIGSNNVAEVVKREAEPEALPHPEAEAVAGGDHGLLGHILDPILGHHHHGYRPYKPGPKVPKGH